VRIRLSPPVAAQERGHCGVDDELVGTCDASNGNTEGSHPSPCVTGQDEHEHYRRGRSAWPRNVLVSQPGVNRRIIKLAYSDRSPA